MVIPTAEDGEAKVGLSNRSTNISASDAENTGSASGGSAVESATSRFTQSPSSFSASSGVLSEDQEVSLGVSSEWIQSQRSAGCTCKPLPRNHICCFGREIQIVTPSSPSKDPVDHQSEIRKQKGSWCELAKVVELINTGAVLARQLGEMFLNGKLPTTNEHLQRIQENFHVSDRAVEPTAKKRRESLRRQRLKERFDQLRGQGDGIKDPQVDDLSDHATEQRWVALLKEAETLLKFLSGCCQLSVAECPLHRGVVNDCSLLLKAPALHGNDGGDDGKPCCWLCGTSKCSTDFTEEYTDDISRD